MTTRALKYRFFYAGLSHLTAGALVELAEGEAHHALHVLRLAAGEAVELFDGAGFTAAGRVVEARRRRCAIEIDAPVESPPRRRPRLHLACALPKAKRQDWLLEKMTELGAASFTPLLCRFSSVKPAAGREGRHRWTGVCIAAARQCRLNRLPELREPATPASLLVELAAAGARAIVADCGAAALPPAAVIGSGDEDLTLLIGPEGGWSDEERDTFAAAGLASVVLGATVLRVETAAVAMLAAATALAGPGGPA